MTICKDLDYQRAEFVSSGSYFGEVNSDFVANLHCNSYDNSVIDCGRSKPQLCTSKTVSGVVCA